MIVEEIYDALIEAGASEEKARAAARAMTNYETRISKIESDLNLLKWMTGFNLAMTVAILRMRSRHGEPLLGVPGLPGRIAQRTGSWR